MKVVQFFTIDQKKVIKKVVWYSRDDQKRSRVAQRVEQYLRCNELSCLMDVVKWYQDRADYELEEKHKLDGKAKFDYIFLSSE